MGRRTRECLLCSTKYEYCPTCSQDKMKPAFMAEFHNENCTKIFDICTRFNMELLSKAEAQSALEKCDLSNKANFKSYVQRDLKNIFAEEPKPVQEKVSKPVAKATKSHEVVKKEKE